MFYTHDCYRPGGKVSDYSLAEPLKNKSIDFYVEDVPMILAEAMLHNSLFQKLPVGLPYGIRVRVWSKFYDTPFDGIKVAYNTYSDLGESVTNMFPADTFDMTTVPWADVIA